MVENISLAISIVDFIEATKPITNVLRGCVERSCLTSVLVFRPSKYVAVDIRIPVQISLVLDEGVVYILSPEDFVSSACQTICQSYG